MKNKKNKLDGVVLNTKDFSNKLIVAILPLQMTWQPKEDITTYELAMRLPYFYRPYGVVPYEVDLSLPHFRHFDIVDPNKYD
jgi:hypothetical protein